MTTSDIRRANWEAIFTRLQGLRFLVWITLAKYGPATTRQLAERTGLPLLTVRPRVTELCDLGFVYLLGRERREGIYAARNYAEARAHHDSLRAPERQLEMPLGMPLGMP